MTDPDPAFDRCETCRWFIADKWRTDGGGTCYRNPPTPDGRPATRPEDFCSKHERRGGTDE